MNYKEFVGYVKNTQDQDLIDLIEQTDDLLVRYNLGDYLLEIDNIIYTDSQASDEDITDAIKETLNKILDNLLIAQGITINDEVLMSEKVELCNGLLDIQDYEDKTIIKNLLSLDTTNEEILSEILSLVTTFNTEKILSMLLEVSFSLISTMKVVFNKSSPDDLEPIEMQVDLPSIMEKYSKFKESIGNKEIYSDKFIEKTSSIGMPFNVYFNLYISDMIDEEHKQLEKVGLDMIGMAIISSDKCLIDILVKDNAQAINTDLKFITDLNIFVTNALGEMVKHG